MIRSGYSYEVIVIRMIEGQKHSAYTCYRRRDRRDTGKCFTLNPPPKATAENSRKMRPYDFSHFLSTALIHCL